MSFVRAELKSTPSRFETHLVIDGAEESAPESSDRRLTTILSLVRDEVSEGCPSGQAFEHAMVIALLACMARRSESVQDEPAAKLRFSQAQSAVVVEYISANLTEHISVSELAALLEMSPSHFTRIFSSTNGMTPYRFIMRERINGCKEMLVATRRSASDVASAYGFSSQSHFTKVFRQFTGMTPKRYKADAKFL